MVNCHHIDRHVFFTVQAMTNDSYVKYWLVLIALLCKVVVEISDSWRHPLLLPPSLPWNRQMSVAGLGI